MIIHRPTEVRLYTFDFSKFAEIVGGDTLTGTPTVTAVQSSDTNITPPTAAPTVAAPGITGATVTAKVGPGGTDGVKYTLTCTCATSGGATLVMFAELLISTRVLT